MTHVSSRQEHSIQHFPRAAYPVEHVCPALHGDTLKHGEHGKGKVIKVGDASIGANPATPTLCAIGGALASIPWERTRCWVLFSYDIYKQRRKESPLEGRRIVREPNWGSWVPLPEPGTQLPGTPALPFWIPIVLQGSLEIFPPPSTEFAISSAQKPGLCPLSSPLQHLSSAYTQHYWLTSWSSFGGPLTLFARTHYLGHQGGKGDQILIHSEYNSHQELA